MSDMGDMDSGFWITVVMAATFLLLISFGAGFDYGRSSVYDAQCAQSCSPRPGEMRDGKCFCLEARP